MKEKTQAKFNQVWGILRDRNVLVAVSGGVDSSVLAALAVDSAKKVVLLTIDSSIVTSTDRKGL
ncbi:MAG: hypothetical protein ACQET3_10755, partial [Promethearchaeati archaeon]